MEQFSFDLPGLDNAENKPAEQVKPVESQKIETRGRPKKYVSGFSGFESPAKIIKLESKKVGEYIIKFADRAKQQNKGEGLDKDLKKDWVNAFDNFLKFKNIAIADSPLFVLILTTLELIADVFDLNKIFDDLTKHAERYVKDKKNAKIPESTQ